MAGPKTLQNYNKKHWESYRTIEVALINLSIFSQKQINPPQEASDQMENPTSETRTSFVCRASKKCHFL